MSYEPVPTADNAESQQQYLAGACDTYTTDASALHGTRVNLENPDDHLVLPAIIDKRREKENSSQVMNVIGDVQGKTCILVDDIIDTAGTICNAADALKQGGASKVVSYATHAVLSGPAIERISNSELDELIVTDTIPLSENASKLKKIKIISMDETLSDAINRVNKEESISAMFL
jgi:ribose-phosphate pyrophosphokinase